MIAVRFLEPGDEHPKGRRNKPAGKHAAKHAATTAKCPLAGDYQD
jgi:hypothetical protein